ncbi:MAG: SDR family oxidoreductase [Ktedonobacteraceae bacterium]|nr:SDR family oxidoreductase [Ktedonobacteraceae bacterium]
MNPQPFNGRTALITGAAGGLGRAFALAFAAEGAAVAIADLNEVGINETAALIEQQHGKALAITVDVADEASTQQMAARVEEWSGAIDILINNAAIYAGLERKPFYEIDVAAWDQVMAVNVRGVWLCAKAVYPYMRRQGRGKIINISSATVYSGSPLWAHYVASKGAILALTRVMAREVGNDNINVNAIAPGFTLTEASLGLMENAAQYGVDRGALKRESQAGDIVGTALYLASPGSDFVTGQTIIVDGGKQFI